MVWSTVDYTLLAASKTALPVHSLLWDPYTANEFTSVGEKGTILFWLLDESQGRVSLNVHEANVPQELMDGRSMVSQDELIKKGKECMVNSVRKTDNVNSLLVPCRRM